LSRGVTAATSLRLDSGMSRSTESGRSGSQPQ
jgi:hypothetical protein